MLWALLGAILITAAAAAAGYLMGYCIGWNDRGIHNRARRAQYDHSDHQRVRWETTLLDDHRRQSERDNEWATILDGMAADPELAWRLDASPRPPALAITGPQQVIS